MSDPLKFTLPVTVGTIRMHVDRTVSVTIRSELEQSDIEFAVIHQAFQKRGWVLFSEAEVDEADIPDEDMPDRDIKSQSQKIRARCFRLHKLREQAGIDSDYDALYRKSTNRLIAWLDTQIAEYDG